MVSDQIEEPMLGYDWLCNQDIIWNFNAKQVLFRNKPVCLKPRTSPVSVSRVYVREKVDVAPYSEQNVPVRLVHMNWRAPLSDWLVQPKELPNGIMVARTILPPDNDHAAIRVLNLNDSTITIQSGCDIGRADMAQAIPYTRIANANSISASEHHGDQGPDTRGPDTPATNRRESHKLSLTKLDEHLHATANTLPDSLTPEQYRKAMIQLQQNSDIFSKGEFDLGCTNLITHHINTGDAHPVHQQLRRHAQAHLDIIDEQVGNMQTAGVVEPASSPWASNIVDVTKHDRTPRITRLSLLE